MKSSICKMFIKKKTTFQKIKLTMDRYQSGNKTRSSMAINHGNKIKSAMVKNESWYKIKLAMVKNRRLFRVHGK